MTAGFMFEELLLGRWPWWAWGLCSLGGVVGIIALETWPWVRKGYDTSSRQSWRDAHAEAIAFLNLGVWIERRFLIALAYVMLFCGGLWFLVDFVYGLFFRVRFLT